MAIADTEIPLNVANEPALGRSHDVAVEAIAAKLHDAARTRDVGLLAQTSGELRALSLAEGAVHLRLSQSSALVEALTAAYYALFPVMIGPDQQFLLTAGMNGLATLVLIWAGGSKRWVPNSHAALAASEFALALELQLLSWVVVDRIRFREQRLRTILEQAILPPDGQLN